MFCKSGDQFDLELSDWSSSLSSSILDQIASTFSSHSKDDIALFDIETLHAILSKDSLKITSNDWLLQMIIDLGSNYSSLLGELHFEFLSSSGLLIFVERYGYCDLTEEIWSHVTIRLRCDIDESMQRQRFISEHNLASSCCFDSQIIHDIPSIFKEFQSKFIRLLYRGSRDGFGSSDFHKKCDGIGNTLTLIESSKHHIFGGYTPCVWDSTSGDVYDQSCQSFLYTLRNPHNLAARKFALVAGNRAILCTKTDGPSFGTGTDIRILDGCNSRSDNYLCFGGSYRNDTGLNGQTVFDGGFYYTVHEIEVFAIGN